MNYSEQRQFLKENRIVAAKVAVVIVTEAIIYVGATQFAGGYRSLAIFGVAVLAVAVSIFYTPQYLHLSVNPAKPVRWQYRIRWRVLGATLIIGLAATSNWQSRIAVLVAVAAFLLVNFLAKYIAPPQYAHIYYWTTDFALIAALLFKANLPVTVALALLCASAHLAIVICRKNCFFWAVLFSLLGAALLELAMPTSSREATFHNFSFFVIMLGPLAGSAAGTAWMVHRAQTQNARNVTSAIRELADFTGYSKEKIRHLWQTSNQQLAENWEREKPSQDDPARMAEWYRQNSKLYMFAISGYNLEYRRIISNLGVLKYARGATLDYGAGNGELLLELAEHGHPTMYYDVEGTSMAFAKRRAHQQGFQNLLFARSKGDLSAAARERGFDTIFSFDVLEHLPDLAAELTFLASLLAPGGRMVFDVPAGSTKAHPMHLNHNLDVKAHLAAKGLQEERTLLQKLSPFKQEKFIFRKPA